MTNGLHYALHESTGHSHDNPVGETLEKLDQQSVDGFPPRAQDILNVPRGLPASYQKTNKSLDLYFVAGPSRYIMVSGLPAQFPRIYLDALLAVSQRR